MNQNVTKLLVAAMLMFGAGCGTRQGPQQFNQQETS
jgi:hypothetical protein